RRTRNKLSRGALPLFGEGRPPVLGSEPSRSSKGPKFDKRNCVFERSSRTLISRKLLLSFRFRFWSVFRKRCSRYSRERFSAMSPEPVCSFRRDNETSVSRAFPRAFVTWRARL